ncbi:hypothetical protein SAMN05216421_2779 [Halopseudomonas xinjiangensis]|uniref:UPF0235 protein SAMN05216421_2779 n=2 Tax=Halopseudomonas xinjiangensis TaxID=487184 RepID=A0A1H1X6J1_9GAMM|nr:hypothetical protein SAMN05216421_2779 [Halopseudomonas xinjiangensis]
MFYRWEGDELVLECHLQPGARQEGFAGVHGERLKIRIAAPPVDGKANDRLLAFLAGAFDVPRTQVRLLRGERSRQKRVAVTAPATLPVELGISRQEYCVAPSRSLD